MCILNTVLMLPSILFLLGTEGNSGSLVYLRMAVSSYSIHIMDGESGDMYSILKSYPFPNGSRLRYMRLSYYLPLVILENAINSCYSPYGRCCLFVIQIGIGAGYTLE